MHGERSQSTNTVTAYRVIKIPNKLGLGLAHRLLSKDSTVLCTRLPGNEVTNYIQSEAVRQYFWVNHQAKVILVTYAVTHKRTIAGGIKEFLTEVVMMVLLENEYVFHDIRSTINEIFGTTTLTPRLSGRLAESTWNQPF